MEWICVIMKRDRMKSAIDEKGSDYEFIDNKDNFLLLTPVGASKGSEYVDTHAECQFRLLHWKTSLLLPVESWRL